MDPGPDQILSCPNCKKLYRRPTWLSGNNYGFILWSDGRLSADMYPEEEDPVVRCVACKKLFAVQKAVTPNKWGYSLPKELNISGTPPITIDDCLEILNNETLLSDIGDFSAHFWYDDIKAGDENKELIINAGRVLARIMIWQKLNDEVRFEEEKKISDSQRTLFLENAKALLPLLPETELDKTFMLLKAELLRNLGKHLKSLKVLLKVKDGVFRKSRRRMVLLNLFLIRKLVVLNGGDSRFKSKLKRFMSWFK